jgi:hypothetical protein
MHFKHLTPLFQNIMVDQFGEFFLVDWGLAKTYVDKQGRPLPLGADRTNHTYYGTPIFGKR